jgi:probable HAF family extracellular repeat protein
VVGVAENTTQDSTCTAFNLEAKPVVWQNGRIQELPTIFGDPDGWGYGINDQGQIVGASGTCFANQPAASLHALLWQDGPEGGVMDLGNLGGTNSNIAFYISNRGQVVGLSGVPGDIYWHAFLWTNKDGMRDLGTLPGDFYSLANNINNKNQAVGISFPATGDGRAVIWQNGVINDLNTLIPPGSHLYLLEAFGINDRGQIAGWGRLANGDHRAFLLTPCDEERANDEGCKDDAAAATDVDPASAAQHQGTLIPGSRTPVGMLTRFRFAWGQRNLGSEAESAPDHRQERPGDTANDDLLGDQILPPGWCWPHCKHHSGSCEVDSNGRLDGQCAGSQFGQCLIQDSANCPRGKRAIRPTVEQCGHGFPVTVDLARKCSF